MNLNMEHVIDEGKQFKDHKLNNYCFIRSKHKIQTINIDIVKQQNETKSKGTEKNI